VLGVPEAPNPQRCESVPYYPLNNGAQSAHMGITLFASMILKFSLNKAEDLMNRGPLHYPEAFSILQKAIDDNPANLDAVLLAVNILGNQDVALDLLRKSEKAGKQELVKVLGPKAFDDDGKHVG
jgi:hypothetical protein